MAVEQVDTQRQGFKRLGVLGEWDNPYLTYTHDYDATDVEIFKEIFDKGAIYRGRKPVHWCSHCHTALAEAEIEYSDEVSPAIFVRFRMTTVPQGLEAYSDNLWVDIWTTTPWTLPADDCVILHPEADYVAVLVDGRAEIMARALVERDCQKFGYEGWELAKGSDGQEWHMSGVELCHNKYEQPIFGDQGVEGEFIYADYVTLEDGTGVVHSAPGHGVDDYNAGMRFGIPVVMPVDDDGVFYKGEGLGTGGPWAAWRSTRPTPRSSSGSTTAACSSCTRTSRTATRTAGAASVPSSSAPRASGSSPWTRLASGARRSRSWARSASTRRTRSSASAPWSSSARTGASRGSATGACPSRRSPARTAARRSSTTRPWTA